MPPDFAQSPFSKQTGLWQRSYARRAASAMRLLQGGSRYGGMEIADARKLKALDDENRCLKKLLAESILTC